MRILDEIWRDIRNGENIDLYLTVLIALGVAILSLLGINVSSFIAPLTLATLGLLAISSLVNRRRLEEIQHKQAQSMIGIFTNEFPSEFRSHFESGKEIWLIGVTLGRTIKNNYTKLEEKLRQGHNIKVLVVHPIGAPIAMAATRNYAPSYRDPEARAVETKASLQLFCNLKKVNPDGLEIRTIKYPLSFGAICVDPDLATGVLYLEHYPFRTISDSVPKFVLRASDGYWYEFFKKEILALWNAGIEWSCDNVLES